MMMVLLLYADSGASFHNSNMELFAYTKAHGCQNLSPVQHDYQFVLFISEHKSLYKSFFMKSDRILHKLVMMLCLAISASLFVLKQFLARSQFFGFGG